MNACAWCLKPIADGRKYCSKACSGLHFREIGLNRKHPRVKVCQQCGGEFERRGSARGGFCSPRCASNHTVQYPLDWPYARLLHRLKHGVKKRCRPLSLSLTVESIRDTLRRQRWTCPLTGWRLEAPDQDGRRARLASPDRLDDARGYEPDNVRFTCVQANLGTNGCRDAGLIFMCHAVTTFKGIELDKTVEPYRKKPKPEWRMTREETRQLWQRQGGRCAYTGWPLNVDDHDALAYSTLDRRDSSRGYEPDNVQFVAQIVNNAKNNFSEADFFEFCAAVARRHPAVPDLDPKDMFLTYRRLDTSPFHYFVRREFRRHGMVISTSELKTIYNHQQGICPLTGVKLGLPKNANNYTNELKENRAALTRIDQAKPWAVNNAQFASVVRKRTCARVHAGRAKTTV